MLKPIKSARQHRAALRRIDRLMEARAGSSEAAELEVPAILVGGRSDLPRRLSVGRVR